MKLLFFECDEPTIKKSEHPREFTLIISDKEGVKRYTGALYSEGIQHHKPIKSRKKKLKNKS